MVEINFNFIIILLSISICKVASFDKSAKKGLSKEQVDYVNSIKQDRPFYTLMLKMDRLILKML